MGSFYRFKRENLTSHDSHFFRYVLQIEEDFTSFNFFEHRSQEFKSVIMDLKLADSILTLRSFVKDCPGDIEDVRSLLHDVKLPRTGTAFRDIYEVQDNITWTKKRIGYIYLRNQISSFELSAKDDDTVTPDFVTEFIDTVIENISDLQNFNDPNSDISRGFLVALKELKFLKTFVNFVSDRCIDLQVQLNFLFHVLQVARSSAMFAWLSFPTFDGFRSTSFSDLGKNIIKPSEPSNFKIYFDVLQALKLVQSQWYTVVRSKYEVDFEVGFLETLLNYLEEIPISPDCIETKENLQEMLKFLRANLINQPMQAFELQLKDIDSVIVDAGLLVYSLNKDKENTKGEEDQVVDFSDEIQRMQPLIYRIIRKAVQFNIPGLDTMDFVVDNWKELLSLYSNSIDSVKRQLQAIHDELKRFQAVVKQDNRVDHYAADFLVYEVDILDLCMAKDVPHNYLFFWMLNIQEDMRMLMAEVAEIQEQNAFNQLLHITKDATGQPSSPQLAKNHVMKEEMVGRTDVMKELRGKLINGSPDLDVISIVGMPGVGKTTLANKLYYDQSIVSYFDARAQCCVSQEYTRKELLLAILCGVTEDKLDRESENELADKLRKLLMHKRYLVLIDDIWEASAWDDLKLWFPKESKGSRIILTSRNCDVAYYAKHVSDPLVLGLFSNEESWMLLRNKVFNKESCPQVIEEVGKSIAKKCGGLPLSVVLVAGILARTEKQEDYWKQVATNLSPDFQSQLEDTINLSYQNLPDYLRPCFLYFAAFSEDQEIQISKLTWLWISEGFVTASHTEKTLEDIAKDYLENLVGRSLVTVSKKSCYDKIKACRIHDLLLEFCRKKAKLENFFERIKRDKGFDPSHTFPSRRSSLHSRSDNFAKWSLSFSHVKSFQFRESRKIAFSSIDRASYTFKRFKFLRVLDLELTIVDSFPQGLTLLKYLAFRTTEDALSLPSNLLDLQTLIVQGIRRIVTLPDTLWKLTKLRHLHIYDQAFFTLDSAQECSGRPSLMDDLQTLSSACFPCRDSANKILAKTPNLQKLRCEVSKFDGSFPAFNNLIKLEMLKISSGPTLTWIKQLELPPNLKKLTLSNFGINLTEVANHSKLEVLKLLGVTISSSEWKVSAKVCEVSNQHFLKLKFLKLENPSFSEWDVSDDAFPCLEHLVLKKCPHLKVIPSCFEDSSSLKSVEIVSCNEAIAESAKAVRDTSIEILGNSGFEVFIRK